MTARHTSFPKSSRLRLASDFRELLRSGKSFRDNGIVVYFRKSNAHQSRLGIIVSKKILGRAVDRNRAKRIIREYYRKEKNNFQNTFDLIVRIVEDHNLFLGNNLRSILERLFKKADLS